MAATDSEVASFLPLTAVEYEIMLALADAARHGYGVLLEVERRTSGAVRLRAGTLYRAINRMLQTGLLEETENRPDPALDDQRRRYYRLSSLGRQVAAAESERLDCALREARAKHLLGGKRA
jgi:DNA-binding PadR family transcriptional regulator